jgi:hypothetical protein
MRAADKQGGLVKGTLDMLILQTLDERRRDRRRRESEARS